MALLERVCHTSSSLHSCSSRVSRHTSEAGVNEEPGTLTTVHSLEKWKLPVQREGRNPCSL